MKSKGGSAALQSTMGSQNRREPRWLMVDRGIVKAGIVSKAGAKARSQKQHKHCGELF